MRKITFLLVCISLIASFTTTNRAYAKSNFGPVINVATESEPSPDVYLLRGFANVFSRGLDEMGKKLVKKGVDAKVIAHGQWPKIVKEIKARKRKDRRKPVILIGHSLGANAAIRVAKALKSSGIKVRYLVTFAATAPSPIPSNVQKATNYYFKTGGWGEPLVKGRGFRGTLKNLDFSKSKEIGHFNIDEQPRLQKQVINNVLRFLRRTRGAALTIVTLGKHS